ncbi:MAG: AAA family ATPase [Candidatus Lokiarchaeia archaeon]
MFKGFYEEDTEKRWEILTNDYTNFFDNKFKDLLKDKYRDYIRIRKIMITKNIGQSHKFGIRLSQDASQSRKIPHYFIEFNDYSDKILMVGFSFQYYGYYTPEFQVFRKAAEQNPKILEVFLELIFEIKEWILNNNYKYRIRFPSNITDNTNLALERIIKTRLFQETPYPSFSFYIYYDKDEVKDTSEFKEELINIILKFKPIYDFCNKTVLEFESEGSWIKIKGEEDEKSKREEEEDFRGVSITGFSDEFINDFVEALEYKKAVILYGPPGTSKSFFAEEFSKQYLGKNYPENNDFIQFHSSITYEEFIGGLDIQVGKENQLIFQKSPKKFVKFCKLAASRPKEKFIFIIDEINRGNISAIFGELIYMIEKRGEENSKQIPSLPAEDNDFFIPENLFIIGTMNTTDRSIAFLDFALRRRFYFFHFKPSIEILTEWLRIHYSEKIADKISEFFELLNKNLETSDLDEAFQLGHTYFMRETVKEFDRSWRHSLYPLLKEYFYDNQEQLKEFDKIYQEFSTGIKKSEEVFEYSED